MHRAHLLLRQFLVMMPFVGNRKAAARDRNAQYPNQPAHENTPLQASLVREKRKGQGK
jgi:hypothetical protein